MAQERYLPVKCPAPVGEGTCDGFLTKIEVSHHSLTGQVCPKCGTLWRVFHGSDELTVEMSLVERLADAPAPLVQVSWGRISKPQPEVVHATP